MEKHNFLTLHFLISLFEPLAVSVAAISLTDVNTLLGTLSVSVSMAFTIWKFRKELKQK